MGYKTRRRRRDALTDAIVPRQPAPGQAATPAPGAAEQSQRLAAALAHALAEPRLVAEIVKASRSNWRAAAYLLERTYPEQWSPSYREAPVAEHGRDDPFGEFVSDELAVRRSQRHDGA
jgi:hypothetical protein